MAMNAISNPCPSGKTDPTPAPRKAPALDLDHLRDELDHHEVYSNGYFERLQRTKFNRASYALHRANFYYRTEFTVKAIAQVCARAAECDDERTLVLFSHILDEECGNGDARRCHAVLMERAHNLFGEVVFGLEPMAVAAARHSPLIIDGTHRYRRRMQELSTGSYPRLLGVAMAMESHAEKMLTHCRTAFRAHADRFDKAQFVRDVEVYFNVHLDNGVEERHAADAVRCVQRNCRSADELAELAYGAQETLKIQLAMWQGLLRRRLEVEEALDG